MFSLPYETTIAGVSFNNDDGSSRQEYVSHLFTGANLVLQDAATPEYPEAVAVFNDYGEQLGFLPSDVAKQLRLCRIPLSSVICLVKFAGRKSASMPYGASIVIGRDRDSVLSKFSDADRRMIEGPNYKPAVSIPSIYSEPIHVYDVHKSDKPVNKSVWQSIGIILISLVIIAPIICFIVYTFKVFSFLF